MDAAAARRDRLKELKGIREAAAGGATENAPSTSEPEEAVPALKFRNYKPRDANVKHEKVEAAKVPELSVPEDTTEQLVTQQDIIEAYAPKKPHMDLKRDCAKRLAKLERRTQRALRELAEELQDGTIEV